MSKSPEIPFDDSEFSNAFPAHQTQAEVDKATEWESFFGDNKEYLEIGELKIQTAKDLEARRKVLMFALNFFDSNIKSGVIPKQTTFEALFKYLGFIVQKINSNDKRIFSVGDKEIIYTFKLLLELKNEGFSDTATGDDILNALDNKYKDLQKIKL